MSQGTWCHLVVGRGSRGPGRGRRGPGAARVEEAARNRGAPRLSRRCPGPVCPPPGVPGENRGRGQPGALSAPLRHPRRPPAAAQTSVAPGPASQASLPGPGTARGRVRPHREAPPYAPTVLPSTAVPAGPTRCRDSGDKGPDLARESVGFAPRRGGWRGARSSNPVCLKQHRRLKCWGALGRAGWRGGR